MGARISTTGEREAMTAAETARHLGITPRTLAHLTDSGQLPIWMLSESGRRIYSRTTIEAHQRRVGELAAERAAEKRAS